MVLIKDPLTWIKSICKMNYDFSFFKRNWLKHCPSNISESKLNWMPHNRGREVNRNHTSNGIFPSLIHVWNAYYEHYLNEMNEHIYHYLMIRFEDFLFKPKSIGTQLCDCFGNSQLLHDDVVILDSPAKPHGNTSNRSKTVKIYSDPEYRYKGYSQQDLQYIYENINHTIVDMFGYQFEVNRTVEIT
eukprot:UN09738